MRTEKPADVAIARLDAIVTRDPEVAHSEADDILLDYVPAEVAAAYRRVKDRQPWWATA